MPNRSINPAVVVKLFHDVGVVLGSVVLKRFLAKSQRRRTNLVPPLELVTKVDGTRYGECHHGDDEPRPPVHVRHSISDVVPVLMPGSIDARALPFDQVAYNLFHRRWEPGQCNPRLRRLTGCRISPLSGLK